MQEIGRVVGMEKRPNTAYEFYFWSQPTAPVGIGTLIKVVSGGETVYGSVVEAHGFNDLESPLHEFLSMGGEAGQEPPTIRPEMRVFKAGVLRREPAEPISSVPIGRVFLADGADLRIALRTSEFAEQFGIPCGCYGSKADPIAAVHLHSQFLLGPESGHLNITGTSGLAAKTSYILFLLKSILASYKDDAKQSGPKGVAALLFNTKGGDLLYLDQAPNADEGDDCLTDEDRKIYERCGVPAGPFERVRYFAPYDRAESGLASLRDHDAFADNATQPVTLSLADVLRHAEVFLRSDDLDAKADAYLQYLRRHFVETRTARAVHDGGPTMLATTIEELIEIVNQQLAYCDAQGIERFNNTHHVMTMEKMRSRINALGDRFPGLIAKGAAEGPLTADYKFESGTVYVIDVSYLSTSAQDLLFAVAITSLRQRMEKQNLGVGRLIVAVDELNKYAPSSGGSSTVTEALREIASRGRYLGLTLFGAQQFRSRVDKEIVGNAATHAFGHIEAEELAQPGYGYMEQAVKEKLRTLEQGEVLVKHPHFAQPVFVRFPRPGCLKGSDGMRRFASPRGSLVERLLQSATGKGVGYNTARDLIDSLAPSDENHASVLRAVRVARTSAEAERALRGGLRLAVLSTSEPKAVLGPEPDDPFA